jgi:hypothetical protein
MNIGRIKKVNLREIWKNEARDFTPWLAENIDFLNDVLGFEIIIESTEQSVGPFNVDIYGEDSYGNKVIIENQLEKTDHTHLGQIITYLVNLDVKTAIWITSNPVIEHQKAIEWLNETTPDDISFYLIQLEAIKIGEGEKAGPLFTVVKRPSQSIKKLGAEKKEYAHRHVVREEFWAKFISQMNILNSLFNNISPTKDNWIGIGLGMSGVSINLCISNKYARVEVYINRGDQDENKRIFDYFLKNKDVLESEYGYKLEWERMDSNVTSRIKDQLNGVSLSNTEDWDKMLNFLKDRVVLIQKVFKGSVSRLRK